MRYGRGAWMLGVLVAAASGAAAMSGPELARVAPLIVIDPGHGGSNTGAQSAVPGIVEKDVTMPIALALASNLRQRGHRVMLTHTADEYVSLRQRVARANRWGADVFVSVHANSAPSKNRRGYETYILTPRAVDIDGPALRATAGPTRVGVESDIALLLDQVEQGVSVNRAADLAFAVQNELAGVRGHSRNRGVKQDSMHVLLGATMPAVLVEVGFINHPVEGRELIDPVVQGVLATAMSRGIDTFVHSDWAKHSGL